MLKSERRDVSDLNGIRQPIVFTGNGTEYAKIFFVNLALSILTLGIYSAWAKVRRKRYFYGNTILAGSSFDYHGKPIQILKGRLLVVGLFIAYNVLSGYNASLAGIMGLIFFAFIPWIILKSTQFNMRNSSYRQIRFDFKGDIGVMFGLYVILPVAAVFTLWLAYPYVAYKQKYYFANHTYFGKSPFVFDGKSSEFFVAYYKAFFSIVLIFIVVGFLFGSQAKIFMEGFSEGFKTSWNKKMEQKDSPASQLKFAIPESPQSASPIDSEKSPDATNNKTDKNDTVKKAVIVFFVLLFYAFVLLIGLVIMTYINTRITNYMFNNLKLTYLRFSSKINYWKLMWIYISNTVLILLTAGIYIPWAKIRAVRYKLSCIEAYVLDMGQYIAEEHENMKAVGEEFSDFFDVDVGL